MYIIVYFLILGIATFITNKINDVESNTEFLKWSKRDLLIIGGLFLVAVVLECLNFILPPIIIAVYAFLATITFVYVNKNREKTIQEYKKQIEQIYEAIGTLTNKDDEIDYNELPFKIEKEDNKINSITVTHENPQKHTDNNCTSVVYSLKNYFPYYDWQYEIDYPKQVTVFTGQALPPAIAMWPSSDYRDGDCIPVGVSGNGEVVLKLSSSAGGESSYIFENGTKAGTVNLPAAPQYLVVGSTGGGKAIWTEQELW